MIIILYCANTDKGRVRGKNEDGFFISRIGDAFFAVVCDGMGGANAGEVASAMAVEIISSFVLKKYRPEMSEKEIADTVETAIEKANIKIARSAEKTPERQGMGTTAVCALIRENRAIIVHAGDSRAYLISDEAKRLTTDHSFVQEMVKRGLISEEDAETHPDKNLITKALGGDPKVNPDRGFFDIGDTDTLLLCSDGLTNYLSDDEIVTIINENTIENAARTLIEAANENGGGDNITAALYSMNGGLE